MQSQHERESHEPGASHHDDAQRTDRSPMEQGEERTETVQTQHGPTGNGAKEDVVTDPALDDRLGSDWSDEGGATTTGPATDTPGRQGAAHGDDPKRPASSHHEGRQSEADAAADDAPANLE